MAKRFLLMARRHWGTLLLATLGLLGAAILNLVTPEVVRRLTGALETPETMTAGLLVTFVLILLGAYLLKAVCRFFAMYMSHVAAWNFVGELTLKVYDKLQIMSMRYYSDKQTGQLMSRMVNDTRMLEVLIAHALPDLVTNLLVVAGVAVMLFLINPYLALLTLIPVPFVVFASSYFSKKVSPLFRVNQQVLGELSGTLQDNLSGMKEIQAFCREQSEHERMDSFCKHYSHVNIRANFANAIFHPSVEFLTSTGTLIVVGVGGLLAMQGQMAIGDIIGFFMYLSLFYTPLAALARLVEDVQTAYAGGVRVLEVLDEQPEIVDKPDAVDIGHAAGKVTFEHVSFSYQPDEPVLTDISFTAQPGQMIALVGATGVGKTTIVSLLERFYEPVSGRILLDDMDTQALTIASLRGNISMVLQDVFLFNGSILDNIAYGLHGATRAQVIEAAKAASADGFIREMPEGYDTLIGERGVRLSGGQKQRIAIARAVLRGAPVLVLDEATSAVDTETEAEIQAAIERLAGQRTVIIIAHRLSTVRRADQILVLDKGEVVQRGTHEQLIAQPGLYAKLCAVQVDQLQQETAAAR